MTTAYSSDNQAYGDWKNRDLINPKPPQVAKTNLGDVVSGDYPIADAFNWLYANAVGKWVGTGDRDLYDLLIKPITGDFNRIQANADAWRTTGEAYWAMAGNLGSNTTDLTQEYWHGDAAQSFNDLVQVVWTGALYVAQQACNWMGKGFDKLAELSIKLAKQCVQILNKIFNLFARLAKKLIPGLGQLWSIFKWIESGGSEIPYVSDAQNIARLIKMVLQLHDTMTNLIDSVKGYVNNATAIRDAVSKIPEVNSVHDAVALGQKVHQGTVGMSEQKRNAQQHGRDLNQQIRGFNRYAPRRA